YRQASAEPVFSDEVEKTRSVLIDLTTDLLEHSSTDDRGRDVLEVVATALVGAGEAVADRIAHRATERSVAADVVVELAWRGLSGTPDKPFPHLTRRHRDPDEFTHRPAGARGRTDAD